MLQQNSFTLWLLPLEAKEKSKQKDNLQQCYNLDQWKKITVHYSDALLFYFWLRAQATEIGASFKKKILEKYILKFILTQWLTLGVQRDPGFVEIGEKDRHKGMAVVT